MWTQEEPTHVGIIEKSNNMNNYKSFKDWKRDFERIQKNPNDEKLIKKVAEKIDNSEKVLKNKIQEYVEENILLLNPMLVIKRALKKYPNSFVVIKDEDDIWFSV